MASSNARHRNDARRGSCVTSGNRETVISMARPYRLGNAMDREWAFSCAEDAVTPDGAESVFAYLQNEHGTPLIIDRIKLNIASTEVVSVEVGAAYAAAGGAELTAVPRTVGGSNAFATRGQFYGGTTVTGAVTMTEIHRVKLASGVDKVIDLSKAPIVLLQGQALQLKAGTGTAAGGYEIQCYWADVPRVDG